MFELLLLSVVMSTAYIAPVILRRLGPAQRVYGLMLVADLVLALLSLFDRHRSGAGAVSDTVGAVAIGAAFCLIMLPSMLRDFGKRCMGKDRFRLAKIAAELRELLQPGMGAAGEVELIETTRAISEGREQEVVDSLRALKVLNDDQQVRRILEERIVMTFLYAQRWEAAIVEYEQMSGRLEQPGSPSLVVEMLRAYCENGQLAEAATLLERIEDSPIMRTQPVLAPLLARGRMIFLAFVGRVSAVDAIVRDQKILSHLPEAARCYWTGIARLNSGDARGARDLLSKAVALSNNNLRANKLAARYLAHVDDPRQLGPHSVPLQVAQLADLVVGRVAEAPAQTRETDSPVRRLPSLSGIPLRLMPVTVALCIANVLLSLLVYLQYGNISDLGALICAGANLKSATVGGQFWRMATSMFLHFGLAHLLLNVYGLWVLGRLVEQMNGSLRTFAIYALSGLGGALASTYLGGGETAAGASGAVVGLMGAAAAELLVYGSRYPTDWSKPLLRLLLLLSAAQLALGFFYPAIDQWGHVGGFGAGFLAGIVFSCRALTFARSRTVGAWGISVLAVGALALSGVARAKNTYTKTLRAYPRVARSIGGLKLVVPSSWEVMSSNELYDPGIGSLFELQRISTGGNLDDVIGALLESEQFGGASRAGFDHVRPARGRMMALPSPWRGAELEAVAASPVGDQKYRILVLGREVPGEVWTGLYYLPETLGPSIEPVLQEILSSVLVPAQ